MFAPPVPLYWCTPTGLACSTSLRATPAMSSHRHQRSRSRSPLGSSQGLYSAYRHTDKDGRDRDESFARPAPRSRQHHAASSRGQLRVPNIWSRSPSPPPRSPSPKRKVTSQSLPPAQLSGTSVGSVTLGPTPPCASTGHEELSQPAPKAALPDVASGTLKASGEHQGIVLGERQAEASGSGSDSDSDSSDGSVAGPQLPPGMTASGGPGLAASGKYGRGLRAGEGEAIAQFVQAGKRVPRRGEVGWSGEEIGGLEDLGYVMSGNRNKRMNAVRLRKENQVYSEEEKRALAQFNYDEQVAREGRMMGHFKQMLASKGLMEGDSAADEAK